MRSFINVKGSNKQLKLNGNTVKALAAMDVLKKAKKPLKVHSIIDGMTEMGVLSVSENEKSDISGILQKLIGVGAVYHPAIQAGSHLYCLVDADHIQVEVSF